MMKIKIRLDKFGSGSRHAGLCNSPIPGNPGQDNACRGFVSMSNNFFSFIFFDPEPNTEHDPWLRLIPIRWRNFGVRTRLLFYTATTANQHTLTNLVQWY
jgi:hypothetical protein